MTLGWKSDNIRTTSYWNSVHCMLIFQDLLKISLKSCDILHITKLLPLWLWQACWNENCGSSPRGLWHDQNFGRPGQNLELLDIQSPSKNPKQIMTFLTPSSSSYCDMWHVPYFDTSLAGTHSNVWQPNHLEIVQYVDSYCEKHFSIFQMRLVCITGNWPVHLRWVVPNTGQSI
jgi:hypothetical protein